MSPTCKHSTPLSQLYGLALQHTMFNPPTEVLFVRGLRQFSAMHPSGITWGSVCSGTGIECHVLAALTHYWKKQYDIDIVSHHKYFCDSGAHVQKHLVAQFSGDQQPILFGDVTSLSELGRGEDYMNEGKLTAIPRDCIGFVGGFSCTSRSPKNQKAASQVNCIQIAR